MHKPTGSTHPLTPPAIQIMINHLKRWILGSCALLLIAAGPYPIPTEKYSRPQWETYPSIMKGAEASDVQIESYYDYDRPSQQTAKQAIAPEEDESIEPIPQAAQIDRSAPRGPLYKLSPGDKLLISIYGEDHSIRAVDITASGTLSYLSVNGLPVNGKTIPELRDILERELSKYYREPIVNITLIGTTGRFFTIFGEVQTPGRLPMLGDTTLLQAIAQAGGIRNKEYRGGLVDTADYFHSFIARRGEYIPVDFRRLIVCGDLSQDLYLNPGDYIFIARALTNRVYVLGEVRGPVVLNSMESISLVEAITAAGGLNRRASSRVVVIRGSLSCPTRFVIDINRILKGNACNFHLCPGDIVYVPIRQLEQMRDIIKAGVSAFVNIVASIAGNELFITWVPKARGETLEPVPVINTGGTSTFNFTSTGGVTTGVSAGGF